MTIAVVLTTHGQAAKAMLASCEMIVGEQENVATIDFIAGENGDSLTAKIQSALLDLDIQDGVLFVVDLWGGTPFNACNQLTQQFKRANVITGMNIPLLISILMKREEVGSFEELVQEALADGADSIRALHAIQTNSASQSTNTLPMTTSESSKQSALPQGLNEQEIERLKADATNQVQNVAHMSFGLWRIDDRLIHGQVATSWTKETRVNRIIVVNDQIAQDQTRITMLKQAVPTGVSAHVVSVDKMMRVYNNPEYAGDKVMLLFTNPSDALTLVNRGVPIQSINIGGMAFKEGRVMLDMSVSVDQRDVEAFKALSEKGIELEVRKVAVDKKVPIMDLIRDKYRV
ncbi:MAG: PTS mannose transporter subunit IIAB [Cardiobacteriaceae bacterium]|nr:PTS mannose transporter subunit IIAB [Cardiobacteriaceae bacterium]